MTSLRRSGFALIAPCVAVAGLLLAPSAAEAMKTPSTLARPVRSGQAADPLAGLAADTLAALVGARQATLSRPGVPDGGAGFSAATAGDPLGAGALYHDLRRRLAMGVAARASTASGDDLDAAWGATSDQRMIVVLSALAQLGTPYRWAGAAPGGFDCSGLAQWSWSRIDIVLPRTARAQIGQGRAERPDALHPGDLVYKVEHVELYLGAGHLVVHAPETGMVVQVTDWYHETRWADPVG